MRNLAEASGLLAGSLYSHFRSKAMAVEEIILGFYDELIPVQQAALEAGGDGAAQLSRMIGAVYRVCAEHHYELTILHYDWRVLTHSEELSKVLLYSEQTLKLWEAAVVAGVADGTLRPDLQPPAVMRVITSSIHGLLDPVRYDSPASHVGPPEDMIAFLQQLIMGGLRSESPDRKDVLIGSALSVSGGAQA